MSAVANPEGLGLRLQPRPKYLSLASCAVQQAIAYRGRTLLNLVSGLMWVAVPYYLWRSVYSTRAEMAGFTWDEMRTYVLLAYAVNGLLTFYSLARLAAVVRSGQVACELLRPLDFLTAQLAYSLGAALVEAALSGGIALALALLFLHILPPASLAAAGLTLASVWLGFLVRFLVGYLVALLCFYTKNALGLIWAEGAVVSLLSGALLPLDLLPGWLQAAVRAAPFASIVYTPLAIYLGKLQGAALWQALGLQALWAAILWALARVLWRGSARALEIQGG